MVENLYETSPLGHKSFSKLVYSEYLNLKFRLRIFYGKKLRRLTIEKDAMYFFKIYIIMGYEGLTFVPRNIRLFKT
jgi:hypothetical protein